jgi:hypothetical protein
MSFQWPGAQKACRDGYSALYTRAQSLQDPSARELSFLERLGLLVDQQWNWRENQALGRRLYW